MNHETTCGLCGHSFLTNMVDQEIYFPDGCPLEAIEVLDVDRDRHVASGKKVICSFFLFENPDDDLPDMDCGFEAFNGQMLGEHIKKENPNVGWINAQDLFREMLGQDKSEK